MICRVGFRPPTHSNRGFTLLEVLVSLTIMALITSVAFAGFSIGIDSWRRGTRKIDDLDRRFTIERVLQRQIGLADHVFRGDRDQLELSTTYSLANGSGDPVWVKYVLEANGVTYFETPFAQYAGEQTPPALTQTFDVVSTNGFHYLYSVPSNQYDWFSEPMKDNPKAVRVDLSGDVLTIPLVNSQ